MNGRIQELARQCRWENYGVNSELLSSGIDEEKFAELIVRECLEQIYSVTIDNSTDDWDQGYNSGLYQAAETIKTHFGVE